METWKRKKTQKLQRKKLRGEHFFYQLGVGRTGRHDLRMWE